MPHRLVILLTLFVVSCSEQKTPPAASTTTTPVSVVEVDADPLTLVRYYLPPENDYQYIEKALDLPVSTSKDDESCDEGSSKPTYKTGVLSSTQAHTLYRIDPFITQDFYHFSFTPKLDSEIKLSVSEFITHGNSCLYAFLTPTNHARLSKRLHNSRLKYLSKYPVILTIKTTVKGNTTDEHFVITESHVRPLHQLNKNSAKQWQLVGKITKGAPLVFKHNTSKQTLSYTRPDKIIDVQQLIINTPVKQQINLRSHILLPELSTQIPISKETHHKLTQWQQDHKFLRRKLFVVPPDFIERISSGRNGGDDLFGNTDSEKEYVPPTLKEVFRGMGVRFTDDATIKFVSASSVLFVEGQHQTVQQITQIMEDILYDPHHSNLDIEHKSIDLNSEKPNIKLHNEWTHPVALGLSPDPYIISPSKIERIEIDLPGGEYNLIVHVKGCDQPITLNSKYIEGRYYLGMHPDKRLYPVFIDTKTNEIHFLEIYTRVDNNYRKSVR